MFCFAQLNVCHPFHTSLSGKRFQRPACFLSGGGLWCLCVLGGLVSGHPPRGSAAPSLGGVLRWVGHGHAGHPPRAADGLQPRHRQRPPASPPATQPTGPLCSRFGHLYIFRLFFLICEAQLFKIKQAQIYHHHQEHQPVCSCLAKRHHRGLDCQSSRWAVGKPASPPSCRCRWRTCRILLPPRTTWRRCAPVVLPSAL